MRVNVIAAAALCALAGCGGSGDQTAAPDGGIAKGDPADGAPGLECALDGGDEWRRDCALERDGVLLTIRRPDGGFRRFKRLDDGRGLESADGAEEAKVAILDDRRIEVRAGPDRYRLPARIAATQ